MVQFSYNYNMIKTIVHYSDLHLKLYKHHTRDKSILLNALKEWKKINPDRIVFTGDLVHSKNQMTPELVRLLSWWMTETSKICPTIYLIGNHDFLENNQDRLDALTPIIENLNNPNITYYKDKGCYEDDNIMWCVYSLVQENERPDIPDKTVSKIRKYMTEFAVMPSMRFLWAAGPAAKFDNTCIYNCSFAKINCVESFAECLYILMCGTGFGFSIESEEVEKLPEIPVIKSGRGLDTIPIFDSKAGWADSVKMLMNNLYDGQNIYFDYS